MEKKGGKRLARKEDSGRREMPDVKPAADSLPDSVPEAAPLPAEKAAETAPAERTPEGDAAPEVMPPVSRARRLWNDYGYLLVTVAVVFLLFRVVLQLSYVPTGSMETTIPTKSLLIGFRLPYVVSDPVPVRGNIVTFWSDEEQTVLVKRVIGLPGDTVSFKGGFVYINGEKLNEDYLPVSGITTSETESFEVPEGCIFVMGDNRTDSCDSRRLKDPYIPVEEIQARVLVAISIGAAQSWQGVHWIA